MMSPGLRAFLRVVVKVISQFSPLPSPDWKAAESSQSTSTPSNKLVLTKSASLVAASTGSKLDEVGYSVAPKALTTSLTPAFVKLAFNVAWISSFVSPKTPAPIKYKGLLQTKAPSTAPPLQVQNERQTQLQGLEAAQPGTPRPWAIDAGGHQLLNLSMQIYLTGQSTVVPYTLLSLVTCSALTDASSKQTQKNAAIIHFILKIQQNQLSSHLWTSLIQRDILITLNYPLIKLIYFTQDCHRPNFNYFGSILAQRKEPATVWAFSQPYIMLNRYQL